MIRDLLYSDDIYTSTRSAPLPYDLSGWGGDHPVIREIVESIAPRLVIEVGTWKGLSALSMHAALKEMGIAHEIVCVDTWLGSIEHMLLHKDDLRYVGGHPTLYRQFLSNVVHAGAEDVITPIVQHSTIAAAWLAHHDVQADLIYIDASHDEGDVIRDIEAYWPLVRPGGVLFGDDYTEDWPGVVADVQKFIGARIGAIAEFSFRDRFWTVRKKESDA